MKLFEVVGISSGTSSEAYNTIISILSDSSMYNTYTKGLRDEMYKCINKIVTHINNNSINSLPVSEINIDIDKRIVVENIKVSISNGMVFDGDEYSQDRMLRAINIANLTGQTSTQWKLADNSIQTVTLDELKEALTLAGQEMSRIWLEYN